jgi:uncharacterized membrane protein YhhN
MMPFPGGIESTENGLLIFSAGAALFYLGMVDRAPDWRRTAAKTLAVAMLAILAAMQGGPLLLVAALALSAIGDAFLSRKGDRPFLAGLAGFLLAHLAYALLFFTAGEGIPILLHEPWRGVIGVAMLAGTSIFILRLRPVVPGEMRDAVTIYGLAILSMGFASLVMPGPWVVLGAVLFMLSDAVLAAEKFVLSGDTGTRRGMRHAVWVLYYLAQLARTLGVLFIANN